MITVEKWTGDRARVLREALRMSQVEFAARLGVSARTVAHWDSHADVAPRAEMQAALDELLARSPGGARERFRLLAAAAEGGSEVSVVGAAHALGQDTDQAGALRQSLLVARRLDPDMIGALASHTEAIRLEDRRVGAAVLRQQVTAHVALMESLLRHVVAGPLHSGLAEVLADTATLAAWQSLDLGLANAAWHMFETAKSAALEAESRSHYAHAMTEQAYVLVDLGLADEATQYVEQAIGQFDVAVPARLRAWMHGVHAEVCAADGRAVPGMRSIERAEALLPPGAGDPDLPFLSLDATHLARWRGHCLARLGAASAVEDTAAALALMDRSFTRAEAGLRCDLATALVRAGERSEALRELVQARALAQATSSARQLRRIEHLAVSLA